MTALERITAVFERRRVAGGWVDEDVAVEVLAALGLDNDGCPVPSESSSQPDVSNDPWLASAIKPARDPQPDE